MSDTDIDSDGIVLGADRLSAEWLGLGTYGVRSTRAISPQEGVFYFEATQIAAFNLFHIGIATGAAPRNQAAGETADGFSVDTEGFFRDAGDRTAFQPSADGYGFVVDYRGAQPVVDVIGEGSQLLHTATLDSVSQPVYIHLSGMRRMAGPQVVINAGNDTVNRPFAFDPHSALNAAGLADVANALVLGWGATHADAFNAPPVLSVSPPSATSIALGDSVTLSATASDDEDGSLSSMIAWDVLSTGSGPERVGGTGGTFITTPNAIGQHPIQISVKDSQGKQARQVVTIQVHGTLPQYADVRLTPEPGLSGSGISVSADGLRAHWTVNEKMGVRANQGLYHGFWYFEGHRLGGQANQAVGLVIGNVSLNPYHFDIAPPSCSVNTTGPGVYQNLIYVHTVSLADAEYYGMAVDYRGNYPTVHIIMNGTVTDTLELKDATVPVYPMLYGNPTNFGTAWDMEINFGGSPFHEDPVQALTGANIDAQGLIQCWGANNQTCN